MDGRWLGCRLSFFGTVRTSGSFFQIALVKSSAMDKLAITRWFRWRLRRTKLQFSITDLLMATLCIGISLALLRLYPVDRGILFLVGFLPGVFFVGLAIGFAYNHRPMMSGAFFLLTACGLLLFLTAFAYLVLALK